MVANFCRPRQRSTPYSIMVKKALDEYFTQINKIYEKRGFIWNCVENHYYIELHIMKDFKPEEDKASQVSSKLPSKVHTPPLNQISRSMQKDVWEKEKESG